jgi:hypothetical protein
MIYEARVRDTGRMLFQRLWINRRFIFILFAVSEVTNIVYIRALLYNRLKDAVSRLSRLHVSLSLSDDRNYPTDTYTFYAHRTGNLLLLLLLLRLFYACDYRMTFFHSSSIIIIIIISFCTCRPAVPFAVFSYNVRVHTRTGTRTYIYTYIYICMCVCVHDGAYLYIKGYRKRKTKKKKGKRNILQHLDRCVCVCVL